MNSDGGAHTLDAFTTAALKDTRLIVAGNPLPWKVISYDSDLETFLVDADGT